MSYKTITLPGKYFNLVLLSTIVGAIILLFVGIVTILSSLYTVTTLVLFVLSHISSAQLLDMQVLGIAGYMVIKKYNKWRKGLVYEYPRKHRFG